MQVRLNNSPWVNYEYISVAHDRDHFSKRWHCLRQEPDREKMRYFRKMAYQMAEKLQAEHIQQEIADNKNTGGLWKAIKDYLPNYKKNTLINKPANITDDKAFSNLFNNAFCGIGEELAKQIPRVTTGFVAPPIPGGLTQRNFEPMTLKDIHSELKLLPIHKSTGIDGVNARIL